MPQGKVIAAGPLHETCPNCGNPPGVAGVQAVTEKGHVIWRGCEKCWPLVARRGQLEVLRKLARAADKSRGAGGGAGKRGATVA